MKHPFKTLSLIHFLVFLFVMNSHAAITFPGNNIGKKSKVLENGFRVSTNPNDVDEGGYTRINADGGFIRFNNSKYNGTSAVGTGYNHFPTDNNNDASTLQYVAMRIRLTPGVTNYSNLEIGLYVQIPNKNADNHKKYSEWTSDGTTPVPSLTHEWQWVVFKTTDVGYPTPWFRVWFTNAVGIIDVSDIYVCQYRPEYPQQAEDNTDMPPIYIKNNLVGIGLTNPMVKLDVAGTMRANDVRVCLNQGCDYVFEENYPLMKLDDLNSFIKANKHLPDVAPAAVMEAEGINVSEMSALLLRKVEELTLYVIEQNKAIKALQQQNTELTNHIEALSR